MNRILVKIASLSLLIFCLAFFRDSKVKKVLISTGPDVADILRSYFPQNAMKANHSAGYELVAIPQDRLDFVSRLVHEEFGRCGGFMLEESSEKAAATWLEASENSRFSGDLDLYQINQEEQVSTAMELIDEQKMLETITSLSSYKNRYYRSQHGIDSQKWILEEWKKLGKKIPEISVESFAHKDYPQPSIVLTWLGESEETIILGGHGDSISGWFPSANIDAPGADDNASGIATITETLRVLIASNFKPSRTIKFISYAAEEVGLRGSADIAALAKKNDEQIIGVMQLDMTNFSATKNDLVLMTDYTNQKQNEFLGQLIDRYQTEATWIESKCGYACSDHASWTKNGFPASFPFESTMDRHNEHIHTKHDTLDKSGSNAKHALSFAKLALAFIIELDS